MLPMSEHGELLAVEASRRGDSFHSIRLEENTGGAGGFHAGMRACLAASSASIWSRGSMPLTRLEHLISANY